MRTIKETLSIMAIVFALLVPSVSDAQRWVSPSRPYIGDYNNAGSYYVPSPAYTPPPDWRVSFVPKDPWRAVNGQTNYVKLTGVEFSGQVVDITSDGVRIDGEWGKLGVPEHREDFLVANFPYEVVNDQTIPLSEHLMAWYSGTYAYETVNGASRTIHKLDYGAPCGPNPDQIAALEKEMQEEAEIRHQTELKKLEPLKEGATNGDSGMQYSLGVHYLYGIGGCETNKQAAVFWLSKSAAQGNMMASNDLAQIVASTNNISLR
ncbi:MAG TPA: hypothetical protein VMF08_20210 [Candidatus Sulfotelmatobacter sp.]|nr:hypothetical protein [Candidatus Sulfotelmatobacter sp.]